MTYRRIIPLLFISFLAIPIFLNSCDELITEQIFVTEAGNPTAEFGSDKDSGCVPLTVNFTDLSTGPRTSWVWSFGDGDSSNDTTPTHIYDSAGVYTVSLRITDAVTNGTDTEVKKRFVVVGQSVAGFTVSPELTCPGDTIRCTPQTYGGITAWSWNFGDGTAPSTDSFPKHVYNVTGDYDITLTATGPCGIAILTMPDVVSIVDCPTVAFTADTTVGCGTLQVQFFDGSSVDSASAIFERRWEFGDNSSLSFAQNPVHTYNTPGTYTVKLRITSTNGSIATDSMIDFINVYEDNVADFANLSPVIGCKSDFQQFQVKFDNTSTGVLDSVLWAFGDNTTSTEVDPVHAYVAPGAYDVTLSVWGPCGNDIITRLGFVKFSDTLLNANTSFTVAPDTIADTSITFTFSSTATGVIIDSYIWDFGDGSAAGSGTIITHKYAAPGRYGVKHTIQNGCGAAEVIDSVTVTAAK